MKQTKLATALLLALAFVSALSVSANDSQSNNRPPRDWEAFVDGLMAAQQQSHHFAGAVVVVVSNGAIAFSKGYGYADFAERKPVDPARTLFRVGSNSKMFVWTAVMQLVEQGKLDLHADVNKYLKGLQIPPTFSEPITLEHLMTHSPGFEDKVIGLFAKTPDSLRPLAELLKNDMPARVLPPGRVTAYSNYGASLAALIVEQTSGLPYEEYLQHHILGPLEMAHATIHQPVPASLLTDLSKGYEWTNGQLKEQPFEYIRWAPVGAMSVSGEDMARFMIAHLGDGALGAVPRLHSGPARILKAETARDMHERLVSFSPKLPGMLHGLLEGTWSGQATYGHGGATIWQHSFTAMSRAANLGVFVAYNTNTGQSAAAQFPDAFFGYYFPSPLAKEPSPPRETKASLAKFEGTYAQSRVSETDLTKIIKLFGPRIRADADGYLVVRSAGEVTRWRQVEPLVFAQVDGTRRLVFREDVRGNVTDFCTSPSCIFTMVKQPSRTGLIPQLAWIGISLVTLAAGFVGFPLAAVLQRQRPSPGGASIARLVAWLTCVAVLSGMAATAVGLTAVNELLFGAPTTSLRAGLTLLVVGSVLALVLVGLTVRAWRQGWWHAAGRICVTLMCLASVGTAAWLYQWNLLGWKY